MKIPYSAAVRGKGAVAIEGKLVGIGWCVGRGEGGIMGYVPSTCYENHCNSFDAVKEDRSSIGSPQNCPSW